MNRQQRRRRDRYIAQRKRATPAWAKKDKRIGALYREAKRQREKLGRDVNVDHIVPLNSPYVCGLHCFDNLEITHVLLNAKKSNNFWPDSPFEQALLDIGYTTVHQLGLL